MSFKKRFQKHNTFYLISNFFSCNTISSDIKRGFKCGKFVSLRHCKISGSHNNSIFIGDHSTLHNVSIYVNGNNNQIMIYDGNELNDDEIVVVGNNCLIEIGKHCSIHQTKLYCGDNNNSLKIGNDCLIGFGTVIMTYDAHQIVNSDDRRINNPGDILINNHVWLASNVTILSNTTISENCVGGARSFLKNKIIPPGSVFVGNGQITKNNINWKR